MFGPEDEQNREQARAELQAKLQTYLANIRREVDNFKSTFDLNARHRLEVDDPLAAQQLDSAARNLRDFRIIGEGRTLTVAEMVEVFQHDERQLYPTVEQAQYIFALAQQAQQTNTRLQSLLGEVRSQKAQLSPGEIFTYDEKLAQMAYPIIEDVGEKYVFIHIAQFLINELLAVIHAQFGAHTKAMERGDSSTLPPHLLALVESDHMGRFLEYYPVLWQIFMDFKEGWEELRAN